MFSNQSGVLIIGFFRPTWIQSVNHVCQHAAWLSTPSRLKYSRYSKPSSAPYSMPCECIVFTSICKHRVQLASVSNRLDSSIKLSSTNSLSKLSPGAAAMRSSQILRTFCCQILDEAFPTIIRDAGIEYGFCEMDVACSLVDNQINC